MIMRGWAKNGSEEVENLSTISNTTLIGSRWLADM